MDINNVLSYYSNNGTGSFNPFSADDEGFEFPIGSNEGTVFLKTASCGQRSRTTQIIAAVRRTTMACGGIDSHERNRHESACAR